MNNIYEDPTIEVIDLYYETDVIRTSVTDDNEGYYDTYEEDPWGDLLDDDEE